MTDPTGPQNPTPEALDSSVRDAQHATATAHAAEAIHTDPALRVTETEEAEATAVDADGRLRVQWIRPTDLAARAGARVLEGSIDLNQRALAPLREAALEAGRDAVGKLRRGLAHREQALTPDTPTTATAPVVGRQGVSR